MYSGVGTPGSPGVGFPIRTSPDQRLLATSPKLIAGCYVLHRLLVSRHPPSARMPVDHSTSSRSPERPKLRTALNGTAARHRMAADLTRNCKKLARYLSLSLCDDLGCQSPTPETSRAFRSRPRPLRAAGVDRNALPTSVELNVRLKKSPLGVPSGSISSLSHHWLEDATTLEKWPTIRMVLVPTGSVFLR